MEKQARPFLISPPQPQDRVGAFAAAVAHDINEELTLILNSVICLLHETGPGHPLYPSVRGVERAALRCAGITDDLLALTRQHHARPDVRLRVFLASAASR